MEPVAAHIWALVLLFQWLVALQRLQESEKSMNFCILISRTAELSRNLENVTLLALVVSCPSWVSGVLALISNTFGLYSLMLEES